MRCQDSDDVDYYLEHFYGEEYLDYLCPSFWEGMPIVEGC